MISIGSKQRRRGMMVIYLLTMLAALILFVSLGVDYARVQLVKTELQRAADTASRYAASSLPYGPTIARSNAISAAADNLADGTAVTLANSDVEFGTWSSSTRTFVVLPAALESTANAVRVTARRTAASGNAVSLGFARVMGRNLCDVKTTAIATLTNNIDSVTDIPSTSNPWLAGMPDGTIANPGNPAGNPDTAPKASPQLINGVPITPGDVLGFDSIDGGANNFTSSTLYNPDGNTGWIISNFGGAEHGKSNLTCPINAVVAVFLDDKQPTQYHSTPPDLDFSTDASRNFDTLSPQLRQVFFIGDGRKNDGTIQRFVVPPGATRLYIGTMDGWEWNNNIGKYTTTIHRIGNVTTVK